MRFLRLFSTQSCYRLRIRCRRLIRDKISGACGARYVHTCIYTHAHARTPAILPPPLDGEPMNRCIRAHSNQAAMRRAGRATAASPRAAPRRAAPRRANHRRNNVKSGILAQPAGLGESPAAAGARCKQRRVAGGAGGEAAAAAAATAVGRRGKRRGARGRVMEEEEKEEGEGGRVG